MNCTCESRRPGFQLDFGECSCRGNVLNIIWPIGSLSSSVFSRHRSCRFARCRDVEKTQHRLDCTYLQDLFQKPGFLLAFHESLIVWVSVLQSRRYIRDTRRRNKYTWERREIASRCKGEDVMTIPISGSTSYRSQEGTREHWQG